MTQAIVRHLSPEEREYQRYLAEIGIRKNRLAHLQADLAAYKEKLGRFSAEYHARVGVLFVELDRIELQIAEYEFRIAQLHANRNIDPEELEKQTKQQFTDQREQLHEDQEETRYYEREHREEQKFPELDESSQASLKDLYLEMVKRFHPDLAKTEHERLQREELMKQVNAAFHERDMSQLRTISATHDIDDTLFEAKSIGEKLVWAIREVSRLERLIEAIRQEKSDLDDGELAILFSRQRDGDVVLQVLMVEVANRIRESQVRQDTLMRQYDSMLNAV